MTSEQWMQGNGFSLTAMEALNELSKHDVAARVTDDTNELYACDVSYKEGERFEEWVKLPLNSKAILEWLGY